MSTHQTGEPVEILLVEDNPGDARLTIEALRDAKVRNHLSVVTDGEAALHYLRRQGPYTHVRRPALVLLDLNLPKRSGREVLTEIKSDPDLRRMPVVVLTSSEAEEDILKAYDLQVNCYISKPVDFFEFMQVIRSIEEFWLTVVRLPPA